MYIRGDLNVDKAKLAYYLGINCYTDSELEMAAPMYLEKHGVVAGFGGYYGLKAYDQMTVIFDESLRGIKNLVTGANEPDYHYINYNIERDSAKQLKYVCWANVAETAHQN